MKELTWKCHVCGEERHDAYISVYKKKSNINGIDFQQNIRYCNDKPECAEGAKEIDFLCSIKKDKKREKSHTKRAPRRKKIRRIT